MADALGTPAPAATPTVGVVSDEDHRIAMAGMVAPATSSLAVRTGVLVAPGSNALVTGTSATGTMTVAIAPHHAITTRGTADGVYFGPNLEAATTVNIAAAPGSNSRIDVVYVKQNDTGSSISVDTGSTQPIYGAVTGTASATPVKPSLASIPGALELATVQVASGATSTNGANVTITQTAQQTTMRGGTVPVADKAARLALTTYPTARALELSPANALYFDGVRWRYEGDSAIVSSTSQRDALTAYPGLRAYDTSARRGYEYDGTKWMFVSGVTPAVTVRRTNSATLSTTWSPWNWESVVTAETTDSGMWSSGTTSRLIATVGGLYLLTGSLGFGATAGLRYIAIRKNGDTNQFNWLRLSVATSDLERQFTTRVKLAAGEYAEVMYLVETAMTAPAYSEVAPRAEMTWVGNY